MIKSRHMLCASAIWLSAGLIGSAVAVAAPADDQQIRSIVAGEAGAIKSLDNAKLATYFCNQYRGQVQSRTADTQIPPMSQIAGYPPGMVTAVMQAAGVSDGTAHKLTAAIQSGDDASYRATIKTAAREVLAGVSYDVHDIAVTDPNATAGVTAQGHDVTMNQQRDFVREGGQWKDCTDPDKHADATGNPLLVQLLQQ